MTKLVLDAGTPTGVGSLPFADEGVAAFTELQLHPELPAAPQLPRRDTRESMIQQMLVDVPGVSLRDDGRITVSRLLAPPHTDDLDRTAWAGTLAFLTAATGREGPVKLQMTGPVTLGLALLDAGAPTAAAFAVARDVVSARIRGLLAEARRCLPHAPIVLVLDEPSMTRALHPGFPLAPEATVDMLSSALATASAEGAAMHGVHCCGPVDWSLVLHAGPDVVSMATSSDVVDDAAPLSAFLDRGGWIAWGVIPTDRPIGSRFESHWVRLNEVWKSLTAGGCDPVRLRTQSLLTPACGLAMHDEAQVPVVMRLVRQVAERVQDQAYAARMSVGA